MRTAPAILVQLSDPHIVEAGELLFGAIDTAAFLRAAVATVGELDPAPDAVVVTGDLVNEGRPAQYQHLRELLSPLQVPVHVLPGNHDERGALRAAFPERAELAGDVHGDRCDFAVDVGPVLRLVALDSLVDGSPAGTLTAQQLAWLDERLGEAPERPTIVAVHHPPFRTGIEHMDAMGMDADAADGFAAVVRRHGHVERITCGHLHRSISRRWAGTVAATVPGVAHAVTLELRPAGPSQWSYEPPAITVHRWAPDTGLVTHQLTIGDFPARPYPSDPEPPAG